MLYFQVESSRENTVKVPIFKCESLRELFKLPRFRTGVNVLKRNSVRLAEVWLDEYKSYYYEWTNNQVVRLGFRAKIRI